jgi:uridine phosphorylase
MSPPWQEKVRENASNWLLQEHKDKGLPPRLLMLFGNSDLFDEDPVRQQLTDVQRRGVFRVGRGRDGQPVAYTTPLFGAPKVAMYLEVAATAGVRVVVAAGYVGGLVRDASVGSLFVPTAALAEDGTSRAYHQPDGPSPADPRLTQSILDLAQQRSAPCESGTIASIDAILLEDDALIARCARRGISALDLETGCLFAVASKLGLAAAAVHLVSDNAAQQDIDLEGSHMLGFRTQLNIAIEALLST